MAKAPPTRKSADQVLRTAYHSGDIDELKSYISFGGVTCSDLLAAPHTVSALDWMCAYNRIDMIDYVIDEFKITRMPTNMMVSACSNSYIELARCLVAKFNLTAEDVSQVLHHCMSDGKLAKTKKGPCWDYLRGLAGAK